MRPRRLPRLLPAPHHHPQSLRRTASRSTNLLPCRRPRWHQQRPTPQPTPRILGPRQRRRLAAAHQQWRRRRRRPAGPHLRRMPRPAKLRGRTRRHVPIHGGKQSPFPPMSPPTLTPPDHSPKATARHPTVLPTTPHHPTIPPPPSPRGGPRSKHTTTRSPPQAAPTTSVRSAKRTTAPSARSPSRPSTPSAAARSCANATSRCASAASAAAHRSSAAAATRAAREWWCGAPPRRIAWWGRGRRRNV